MKSSILPTNESQFLKFLETLYEKLLEQSDLSTIDTLPRTAASEILPELSRNFDIDITNLNEAEARELLSSAIFIHKNSGTPSALKKALKSVFEQVEIQEWFEYGGEPFTFRVKVSSSTKGNGKETFLLLDSLIQKFKNVRSVLDSVEYELFCKNKDFNANLSLSSESLSIYPHQVKDAQNASRGSVGSAVCVYETLASNIGFLEVR
ncbi:MAG: phage tail protein I [Helicobacter sp.]|nr:phage tail protein I [Helicobacter sp.]